MKHQWLLDQLDRLAEEQPHLVERALAQLLRENADLRRAVVIGAYLDEEISLAKAAELLDLTRDEIQEQFLAAGIPVRQLTRADVVGEVAAARRLEQT